MRNAIIKAYIWLTTAFGSLKTKAIRILMKPTESEQKCFAFISAPIMLVIIQLMVLYAILIPTSIIIMVMMGSSWAGSVATASGWVGRFGVPIAALSILLSVIVPPSRRIIRMNGGLGWVRRSRGMCIIAGFIGGMVIWMILTGLVNLLYHMGIDVSGESSTTSSILDGSHDPSMTMRVISIVNMVFSVIISPVVEEMFFRGFLSRSLISSSFLRHHDGHRGVMGYAVIIIITGVWFGLAHINMSDTSMVRWFIFLWMTFMGAMLSWMADRVGLLAASVMHIAYNAITLSSVLFPAVVLVS